MERGRTGFVPFHFVLTDSSSSPGLLFPAPEHLLSFFQLNCSQLLLQRNLDLESSSSPRILLLLLSLTPMSSTTPDYPRAWAASLHSFIPSQTSLTLCPPHSPSRKLDMQSPNLVKPNCLPALCLLPNRWTLRGKKTYHAVSPWIHEHEFQVTLNTDVGNLVTAMESLHSQSPKLPVHTLSTESVQTIILSLTSCMNLISMGFGLLICKMELIMRSSYRIVMRIKWVSRWKISIDYLAHSKLIRNIFVLSVLVSP